MSSITQKVSLLAIGASMKVQGLEMQVDTQQQKIQSLVAELNLDFPELVDEWATLKGNYDSKKWGVFLEKLRWTEDFDKCLDEKECFFTEYIPRPSLYGKRPPPSAYRQLNHGKMKVEIGKLIKEHEDAHPKIRDYMMELSIEKLIQFCDWKKAAEELDEWRPLSSQKKTELTRSLFRELQHQEFLNDEKNRMTDPKTRSTKIHKNINEQESRRLFLSSILDDHFELFKRHWLISEIIESSSYVVVQDLEGMASESLVQRLIKIKFWEFTNEEKVAAKDWLDKQENNVEVAERYGTKGISLAAIKKGVNKVIHREEQRLRKQLGFKEDEKPDLPLQKLDRWSALVFECHAQQSVAIESFFATHKEELRDFELEKFRKAVEVERRDLDKGPGWGWVVGVVVVWILALGVLIAVLLYVIWFIAIERNQGPLGAVVFILVLIVVYIYLRCEVYPKRNEPCYGQCCCCSKSK